MRGMLLVALISAALAAGWVLLGPGPQQPAAFEPDPETEGSEPPEAWMLLRLGTLTLHVTTHDGQVPFGAQVGFETPRGPKLYYVPPEGTRTLTDVLLGDVVVLAQAPGYLPLRRPTRVEAGVPGELRLLLEREKQAPPGPR